MTNQKGKATHIFNLLVEFLKQTGGTPCFLFVWSRPSKSSGDHISGDSSPKRPNELPAFAPPDQPIRLVGPSVLALRKAGRRSQKNEKPSLDGVVAGVPTAHQPVLRVQFGSPMLRHTRIRAVFGARYQNVGGRQRETRRKTTFGLGGIHLKKGHTPHTQVRKSGSPGLHLEKFKWVGVAKLEARNGPSDPSRKD